MRGENRYYVGNKREHVPLASSRESSVIRREKPLEKMDQIFIGRENII
jgi:hypothetical protein